MLIVFTLQGSWDDVIQIKYIFLVLHMITAKTLNVTLCVCAYLMFVPYKHTF